jgi:hypothetical protein
MLYQDITFKIEKYMIAIEDAEINKTVYFVIGL